MKSLSSFSAGESLMQELWSTFSAKRARCAVLSLLFAMLLGSPIFAGAEHLISLRIVEAKTGKPIQKVTASIVKWNKDGRVEVLSQGMSNAEGFIIFHLSEPLPDRIGFDFSPNELGYCSDLAFSTAEIVSTGVVAQNKCQTSDAKFSFNRKAEEITLFAQKVSLWERIRREFP
jgi:hypothetical protein